jgi:hypothetical protein
MVISLCDRFHTLPDAGGIYDQDVNLVRMLKIIKIGSRESRAPDAE